MKHGKRVMAIVICVLMLASLWGCGKSGNGKVPQLYLYGDMAEMHEKKDVRSVTATFVQGRKESTYYATIKVQGTSSLVYDKKNYTIKFFDDAAHETESTIDLGWGAQNEYCLKANWIDKTHARNIVTAQLAAEVQGKYGAMEQAPCNGLIDGFVIEVYINDEFHGIYTCNIPKTEWMFGMDEDNPNHIVMCGEKWDGATLFEDVPNLSSWSVEIGPEDEETLQKFTRLSQFIINSSDEEFREHFDEYLDLDSALNYYILTEFAYLPDNCGKNMLMVTYDGNIWHMSLYDLDTSWGADYMGMELWDYENAFLDFSASNHLAKRIAQVFPQELHERYFALRKNILTKKHILGLFDSFSAQISDELKNREIEKWGNEIPGFEISQIESYLDFAIDYLDERYRNFAVA